MRTAIGAAIIEDGKILLVKKIETWILPGGKPKVGEDDLACLKREIGEELSGLSLANCQYFDDFEGITPHRGDKLRAKVYLADIAHNKEIKPSGEISEVRWISKPEKYVISEITQKIIEALRQKGFLSSENKIEENNDDEEARCYACGAEDIDPVYGYDCLPRCFPCHEKRQEECLECRGKHPGLICDECDFNEPLERMYGNC